MYRTGVYDDHPRVDLYYVVEDWDGEPQLKELDKADLPGWFRPGDLPKPISEHARYTVRAYEGGMTPFLIEKP